MERPRAIFLIGFPGAGKSTWRAAYLATAPRPTAIISTDDLVLEHARAHGLPYHQAVRRWRKLQGRAPGLVRQAVARGDDLIVDRTNLRAASRAKLLRLLPEAYERRAVVFVTPPETLRARLAHRAAAGGHAIAWGFVIAMMKGYEPPVPGEYDAVEYVVS